METLITLIHYMKNVATDTTYEDSWVNNAQGPVSYDDTYYYYIKNTSSYSQSGGYKKGEEQIVRVPSQIWINFRVMEKKFFLTYLQETQRVIIQKLQNLLKKNLQ